MLKLVVAVLLVSSAFAQDKDKPTAAALPPICGASGAKFEVKTDSAWHPVAEPEAGKALVYFYYAG
jgi:hypothetical protein